MNVYEDSAQCGMGFQPMRHRQDADATFRTRSVKEWGPVVKIRALRGKLL